MVLPEAPATKSYWIEAAESELRDFRSSERLPPEADVVIVGSGCAGASTAYWLHKFTERHAARPRMVLLEAHDICGAATGRSGGLLRPHAYARYVAWSGRFGPAGAMKLIRHEMAHLSAFRALAEEEGFAEEVGLQFGDTFDAAMTEEAWARLRGNYEAMERDHGADNDVVQLCRLIEDSYEAQEFSQIRGAVAAIAHPAAQIWPYKFVHALLRIVLESGRLNLQAHTPAHAISQPDAAGWITVATDRGEIRTRSVVHATGRWASHLLPEFDKLILGQRATLAALKAPAGLIRHTGSQHWTATVHNHHLQLPPPHNAVVVGASRSLLSHGLQGAWSEDDDEHEQVSCIADFLATWPTSELAGWQGPTPVELSRHVNDGGCWMGIESSSVDSFPFVGAVPNRAGHFIAAGFTGHGMSRTLLSAAHIAPLVLDAINLDHTAPSMVRRYPPLPMPFHATPDRVEYLITAAFIEAELEAYRATCRAHAQRRFCD